MLRFRELNSASRHLIDDMLKSKYHLIYPEKDIDTITISNIILNLKRALWPPYIKKRVGFSQIILETT